MLQDEDPWDRELINSADYSHRQWQNALIDMLTVVALALLVLFVLFRRFFRQRCSKVKKM
jgi:hypothetical protein